MKAKGKKTKGLSDSELIEKYEKGKIDLGKKIKKMIENPYQPKTSVSRGKGKKKD